MVMHAADAAGIYIPHFCYHKKLTIAANCRMCLVEIEKAPKPMPACATPATNGMVVRTKSDKALKAQQSVMEFLLINHPLDCPICDQGGECQLQDLAVGYGGSASRYTEEKRVVFHKDVGPLISMEEMSRCIHCTRCVRFGQEVAGVMELGMIHRGEHSEITTMLGDTIDSELSGNMIDICPVGALTSKPFRYSARTWELSRRKSISPHDSTGANLIVQVKANQVMRVVPLENEDVNECWIADRDRFSLRGAERRAAADAADDQAGRAVAGGRLEHRAGLRRRRPEAHQGRVRRGGDRRAGLGAQPRSRNCTCWPSWCAAWAARTSTTARATPISPTAPPPARARWLGTPIASLSTLQRAFVIGSFLRKDHPLFAQRLRQAVRQGAQVHSLHAVHDDWAMPVAHAASPRRRAAGSQALAEVAAALAQAKGVAAPVPADPGDAAQAIAASLLSGERKAVLLGNAAAQHPQAAQLLALAQWIAAQTGASGRLPGRGRQQRRRAAGRRAARRGRPERRPDADAADEGACCCSTSSRRSTPPTPPRRAPRLQGAGLVVSMTPFKDADGRQSPTCCCRSRRSPKPPAAFVNAEGRLQSFHGVVRPLGETRPAWKVLRVLGNLLGLAGFEQDTAEEVRAEALGDASTIAARLDNRAGAALATTPASTALERIADVPIYAGRRTGAPRAVAAGHRRCARAAWSACRARCGASSA